MREKFAYCFIGKALSRLLQRTLFPGVDSENGKNRTLSRMQRSLRPELVCADLGTAAPCPNCTTDFRVECRNDLGLVPLALSRPFAADATQSRVLRED